MINTLTEPRCESGGLRHNGKHDIYSHAETSGARRGAFFRFSCPTLQNLGTMDRPRRIHGMREAHSVWGSTAPCSADCRVSSNLSSEERQRRPTMARAAKIRIDNPPHLTEAQHDGTGEREKIKSISNIAQARTGAEIVSEMDLTLLLCTPSLPIFHLCACRVEKLFFIPPVAPASAC